MLQGTVTVGIDATEFFDYYEALDAVEYRTIPRPEISQMAISQSVECPLTVKDTAVLSGSLTAQNGNGGGSVTGVYRRVLSHKSWAEVRYYLGLFQKLFYMEVDNNLFFDSPLPEDKGILQISTPPPLPKAKTGCHPPDP